MAAARAHFLVGQDDPWLGACIGRPALRLGLAPGEGDDAALRARLRHEVLFATAKVPVADVAQVAALTEAGCRVVDVNLTFAVDAAPLRERRSALRVRPARPADRAAVEDVAGTSFRFTRFHLDPAFPDALADRVKRDWAGNFFTGNRGSAMLVAEDAAGAVRGFLQVVEHGDAAVIDLIAVAPASAGRGLGRAMVSSLAATPLRSGVLPARLMVGSQAANTPAVRLYEGLGFRLEAASFVLHHHGCGQPF